MSATNGRERGIMRIMPVHVGIHHYRHVYGRMCSAVNSLAVHTGTTSICGSALRASKCPLTAQPSATIPTPTDAGTEGG